MVCIGVVILKNGIRMIIVNKRIVRRIEKLIPSTVIFPAPPISGTKFGIKG